MDCIFCKIIAGEIPSYKLYEDDYVYVFLDINPETSGHTLVIPKVHTLDVDSIDNDTLIHVVDVARKIKALLEEKLGCDGIKLLQNNGDLQEVKHYHLHLIPYYKNGKNLSVEEVYELLK